MAEFLASRVLIGLGGAGLIVMAFSVLTVLFSQQERPKAVGVMAGVTFVAFPIGPILGGWLLSSYWWGWVFLINVPVVVVSLAAVVALVPESRATERPGLDLVGVVFSAGGLVAVTYGLIRRSPLSPGAGQWRGHTDSPPSCPVECRPGHPLCSALVASQ